MNKIGLISAMEEELLEVKKVMTEIEEKEIDKVKFIIGKICNRDCVLAQSGVGKVHAARTTQVMIDRFNIESIINIGSAGAINDKLNIGDVVIGKHVVQHDFDITAFNHKKGYITGIGDNVPCSDSINNKLKEIIKEKENEIYKIKLGVVVTGDIFCTEIAMKEKIRSKFDADVVDMESAAIGQVAFLNRVPFGAIRSVSDTPNGNNATTFDENLKLASERAALILRELIKK